MRATTYICLLLAWGMAVAQGTLEVIELRHTTADRVIPVLRPLLEPGGVLTGQRTQLIVRASPENLAELRRALEAIDRPARRLVIAIRFAGDSGIERTEVSAGVRGERVELRARQERATGVDRVDQRVQVLEGGRAFITTGSSRPLMHRDGTVIQDIATGFEVVPRLAGDEVLLEVAPQREVAGTVARGSVGVQRAASTIRARLGEWVELAGAEGTHARQRIWVRVDEARP